MYFRSRFLKLKSPGWGPFLFFLHLRSPLAPPPPFFPFPPFCTHHPNENEVAFGGLGSPPFWILIWTDGCCSSRKRSLLEPATPARRRRRGRSPERSRWRRPAQVFDSYTDNGFGINEATSAIYNNLKTEKEERRNLELDLPGAAHSMTDLVARTGRLQQRYEDGCRLVAGCIPFKYKDPDGEDPKAIEVLMINSQSGPGLLFPKGGWEDDETVEEAAVREAIEEAGVRGDLLDFLGFYYFRSKTHQDEFCPEGRCKAAMFALHVKEELESWPEQNTRRRSWVTTADAEKQCRHAWMRDALVSFIKWCDDHMANGS